jgi:hypothetical protein
VYKGEQLRKSAAVEWLNQSDSIQPSHNTAHPYMLVDADSYKQ